MFIVGYMAAYNFTYATHDDVKADIQEVRGTQYAMVLSTLILYEYMVQCAGCGELACAAGYVKYNPILVFISCWGRLFY